MSRRRRRGLIIGGLFAVAALAVGLILISLNDNIVFFFSPTDARMAHFNSARKFRLGGLVVKDSLKREGKNISFAVTDGSETVPVRYQGALPDLFREGQGVVAEGRLENNIFHAENVLAKHDENYMPREVADSLKKQGYWRESSGQAASPQP